MKGTDVLVGIDVGTTLCKAAVVSLDGVELAHASVPTPWTPVATGAEVDPLLLRDAALTAAAQALDQIPQAHPLSVGVTSMAETGALLDGRGEPVVPAIAWYDTRGEEQAARLASSLGEDDFAAATGLPLTRLCTLSKLRWLLDNDASCARGERWLSIAELLVHALGGEPVAELSLASRTGLLQLDTATWWGDALHAAGVPDDVLPHLVQAGTPCGVAGNGLLPQLQGAVLTVAGHDHHTAAVGAGAVHDGDLFLSCGTAEAVLRAGPAGSLRGRAVDAVRSGLSVGWHVIPGQQVLVAGFRAGLALRRILRLLGRDDNDHADLDAAALAASAGARGVRVEGITEDAAAITGIGLDDGPGVIWRAALEAVAAISLERARRMDEIAGPHTRIVAAGGWWRNAAYRGVRERTHGSAEVSSAREAGARGAALTAGIAAGVFASFTDLPPPSPPAGAVPSRGEARAAAVAG